jgi:hypothetical protein
MALILQPTSTIRRERILAYGPPGGGKSYMWQHAILSTPSHVQFHVIDTDGAWETAAAAPEFSPHLDRVHHHEPATWPEYISAMRDSMKVMDRERGDWLVIDLADDAWEAAQEYYSDRKFAGDADSLEFLEAIIDGTSDNDQDNMAKWGTINKLYSPFGQALVKVPGNLFVCATAKELKKDNKGNYFRESKDNVREYGKAGLRPGGQKNLGHDVNTVLLVTGNRAGNWRFERIKDRNREAAWGEELVRENKGFGNSFLLAVAGWKPVVGG